MSRNKELSLPKSGDSEFFTFKKARGTRAAFALSPLFRDAVGLLHRSAGIAAVNAHFDEVVNGGILSAVLADILDEISVHAVDAHGDELIGRDGRIANIFHGSHKLGADAVNAESNKIVGGEVPGDELLHLLDEFRSDAMDAEGDEIVHGECASEQ